MQLNLSDLLQALSNLSASFDDSGPYEGTKNKVYVIPLTRFLHV